MKKHIAIALSALTLTACGITSPVEALLSPPTVSDEQEAVYNALISDVGDNITMVYPKEGEHRGAYIFADLNGDGEDEAAALYQTADSPLVHVNILTHSGGAWHSVYDHSGYGGGVERVFFTKFASDKLYMCLGYTSTPQNDKIFTVYSFDEGRLEVRYSEFFNLVCVEDIDLDGGEDIVLINAPTDDHPAYALLVTDPNDGSGVRCTSSALMRSNITEQLGAVTGGISGGAAAVFVDSSSAGGITTEVLYCTEGILRNPAALEDSHIPALTLRRNGSSADIDSDGIVEIPTLTPFPGYRESDNINVTVWNEFENYSLTPKYNSLYMPSQGYCFLMPTRWKGLVTMRIDASSGERVFYKFNSSLTESRRELMRIASADIADKDELAGKGYEIVAEDSSRCIAVRLADSSDPLVLTLSEVQNGIILI